MENKYLLDMKDVVIHYETDEGVVEAVASLENNNATIKYNGDINRQVFVDAIIKAGYEVK